MSDQARHARVKEIFLAAIDRAAGERDAFVTAECGADRELEKDVRSLLAHHVDAPLIEEKKREPNTRDPLDLAGVTLDDRYHVESYVAEGGFGYVYRAEHLRWRRPVAIKIFKTVGPPELQDALRAAFVKEGALLNELSRKTTAIAQSYDTGSWKRPNGAPLVFTVLEWLDGRSLSDVLGKAPREPWPIVQVIEKLGPVAEALAIAHAAGVAHRDVKPHNIFLTNDASVPIKLLDFGAAKVAAELPGGFANTGQGLTTLTASYAAPEQINKKYGATGPWSDVYSLALVCIELMLGRHPQDTGVRLDFTLLPTPIRVGLKVPRAVQEVFERAFVADPKERFQNAGEFWTAFTQAAERRETSLLPFAIVAAAVAALAIYFLTRA